MTSLSPIRFRIAACSEDFGDGKQWSFYVLNDGDSFLDRVVLDEFEREWGNDSDITHPNVEITGIASGASALLWRDNDNEFRMLLYLQVRSAGEDSRFIVKFPTLYKRIDELPVVAELDKPGYVVSATRLTA